MTKCGLYESCVQEEDRERCAEGKEGEQITKFAGVIQDDVRSASSPVQVHSSTAGF